MTNNAPRTWSTLILESAIALRCRFGGVPYGDQGLFISRQTYIQVGGHAPWPLFEEVPLSAWGALYGEISAIKRAYIC